MVAVRCCSIAMVIQPDTIGLGGDLNLDNSVILAYGLHGVASKQAENL